MEELLDVARDDLVRVLHVAHGVVDHANGDSVMVSPPLPEDPDVEALSALVRREFADEAPVLGRLVSALAREAASRVDAHVDALLQWMELLPAKARVVVLVVLFEWQRKAKGSGKSLFCCLLVLFSSLFFSFLASHSRIARRCNKPSQAPSSTSCPSSAPSPLLAGSTTHVPALTSPLLWCVFAGQRGRSYCARWAASSTRW